MAPIMPSREALIGMEIETMNPDLTESCIESAGPDYSDLSSTITTPTHQDDTIDGMSARGANGAGVLASCSLGENDKQSRGPRILFRILPSVVVYGREAVILVESLPALSAVMARRMSSKYHGDHVFSPFRRLFVTSNPDDTYSTLNDLELIAPEATSAPAKYVSVLILEFGPDQAREENLVRRFLQYVEPARQSVSIAAFMEDLIRGFIDGLTQLYIGHRRKASGLLAGRALMMPGQLCRSTYYGIRAAMRPPKTKPKDALKKSVKTLAPDRAKERNKPTTQANKAQKKRAAQSRPGANRHGKDIDTDSNQRSLF